MDETSRITGRTSFNFNNERSNFNFGTDKGTNNGGSGNSGNTGVMYCEPLEHAGMLWSAEFCERFHMEAHCWNHFKLGKDCRSRLPGEKFMCKHTLVRYGTEGWFNLYQEKMRNGRADQIYPPKEMLTRMIANAKAHTKGFNNLVHSSGNAGGSSGSSGSSGSNDPEKEQLTERLAGCARRP